MSRETVEVECRILGETDNALRIYVYGKEHEVWIPLSQVEAIHKYSPRSIVVMTRWIAQQKDLL